MENLTLKVSTRTFLGKKNKFLRRRNKIPAVVYGHNIKPQALEIDYLAFEKMYEKAGESTLIDLLIDQKSPVKVLIQAVQLSPVSDRFLHVDFHQVKMTEKITAEVPLKFIGESKAVKEQGGILVKNLDHIKIECLPNNLIHELEVDISQLENINDSILINNLKVPAEITVLQKMDDTIVLVEPPRSEEELKALEEKPEVKVPEEVVPKAEEAKEEKPAEVTKTEEQKKE